MLVFPDVCFPLPSISPSSKGRPSTSTTTSTGSHGLVVQDGKQRLRAGPFPDIDFLGSDSQRRILDGLIVEAILAKTALPVCWHLETQGHRPQMRDLTEEING